MAQTDQQRYLAAAHAMQSGVAMEQELDARDHRNGSASNKHLRVGVNAAMVEHSALVTLLVAKGLFTLAEFDAALADMMEAEVKRYEFELSARTGTTITLR